VASVASKVNAVWLSVDYRLGPEHKFQTQIEDCRSVLEWVAKNKTQFSSKSAKIGVSGKHIFRFYYPVFNIEDPHGFFLKIGYKSNLNPNSINFFSFDR